MHGMHSQTDVHLSAKDAKRLLGVRDGRTLAKMVARGDIRGFRLPGNGYWRYSEQSIHDLIERRQTELEERAS